MSANPEAVRAIVESRHGQPFSVLGPHVEEWEGKRTHVVRSFQPEAKRLWIIHSQGMALAEAKKTHHDGFWEAELNGAIVENYRLKMETWGGNFVELEDPYSFPSLLTSYDLHLLREGTHYRIWEKMGAHLTETRQVKGVHFAVWAPNASRVSVVGDFNQWDGRRHLMRKHEGNGIWDIFIPGLVEGETYKYELKSHDGSIRLKTDPFAFAVELPPKTASCVHDLKRFRWTDNEWMEKREKSQYTREPISVYEVHLGSWKHIPEENRSLNYKEAAKELGAYVKEMGFTHIELMPITEHPFYASWGYQTVNFFAPTSRYGTPDELKYFINEKRKIK